MADAFSLFFIKSKNKQKKCVQSESLKGKKQRLTQVCLGDNGDISGVYSQLGLSFG